jgi:putative ABC transport system substrate-binding protein
MAADAQGSGPRNQPRAGHSAAREYRATIITAGVRNGTPALGVQAVPAVVNSAAEIERAVSAFAQEPNGSLLALPGNPGKQNGDLIIALAARHRLPAMYTHRFSTPRGGLISYDTDIVDLYRRAALYVDRILKGEKPGELPVQLPAKYDLVINLKTAKTLGLTGPDKLLVAADEVIE